MKHIPNMVTLGNLACGLLGISQVLQGQMQLAFLFMLLGAVLDFFDGFLARALKADGELGKQLDSLADLVTFGVLPGLIWRFYMNAMGFCNPNGFCINAYVWLFIPLGAAYRLAKFNIDTRQTTGFLGVPTPITGITLASWAWMLDTSGNYNWAFVNIVPYFQYFYMLLYMPLLASYLMISDWPMLALKFKSGDPLNAWKYALLAVGALSIIVFGSAGIATFYFAYLAISFISNSVVKSNPSKL